MRKIERLLLLLLCAAASASAVFLLVRTHTRQADGRKPFLIRVEKNGEFFGEYPAGEDREIAIGEDNLLVIEDGEAYMKEASCPDQLCIRQFHIENAGDLIVCLPNRVVVTALPEEGALPDAVAW